MRLLLACCTAFILHSTLLGQAHPPKGWVISAGWAEHYIGDQHSSPLLYHSDVLQLETRYTIPGKTHFEVGLHVQVGTIQAQRHRQRKGVFHETPNLFEDAESYDFVVNPFFSHFGGRFHTKLLWDIGANSKLGVMAQARYDLAGIAGDTWQFAVADIGPSYQYRRAVHQNGAIKLTASLPLAALVVRPNWAVDASLPDETNYFKGYLRTGTRLTTLHELQHPRVSIGYQYRLPKGKTLSIDYRLQWLSYSEPRPLRILEHGLRLSYSL